MKPRCYHYWLAHTFAFSVILGTLGGILFVATLLYREGAFSVDPIAILLTIVAIIIAALLGAVIGTFFIWWCFLGHISSRIQGWPFQVGDKIYILKGPHKDTVARIYEVWHERGQVRVELGLELKKSVNDVFCAVDICRARREHTINA